MQLESLLYQISLVEGCGYTGHTLSAVEHAELSGTAKQEFEAMRKNSDFELGMVLDDVKGCLEATIVSALEHAPDDVFGKTASSVINAARAALSAAGKFSENALRAVADGHARDFRRLSISASEGRGNETFAPGFFSELWSEEGGDEGSEGRTLLVFVDIRSGMSAEDINDSIGKLVLQLDALHRAYGGHGLTIEGDGVFIQKEENIPLGDRS